MILVSACLAGINCNYKGKSSPCPKIIQMVKLGYAIPVCPEQLGGLPTPRNPAEIHNGKVITKVGQDVTEQFIKGADEGLAIAQLIGCSQAILKSKSPSCGVGKVYDGTHTKTLIEGNGIFTKRLKDSGIEVKSEEEC